MIWDAVSSNLLVEFVEAGTLDFLPLFVMDLATLMAFNCCPHHSSFFRM